MKIKKNTRYLIETKEDLQDFLERCEEKGWKWQSKDRPLDFMPYKIPCVIVYTTESPWEGLGWSLYTNSYDKIYKRKTPPTLAEFLGWEEEQEYELDLLETGGKAKRKIIDGILYLLNRDGRWTEQSVVFLDNLEIYKNAKKVEEPKLYAKIKGWELKRDCEYYWSVLLGGSELENRIKGHASKFTKSEWNKLGINDTNADFEEVAE